ncbi:carbohydrate ABC transporter permease [Massiliimalia massiliensis]|uniref:carbohydrate ABC transporter permease n=1 Tax=Massiliimalia massiliensis TaxID=1852384 RepID=UPI000986CCBC|nr:carbohydrate ABC transporter permease [Massiliimalia massiliensis]
MIRQKRIANLLLTLLLWILVLLIVVPMAMIVLNSVKSVNESAVMSLELPTSIHTENFTQVLADKKIFRSFFNSIFLSVASATLSMLLSALAAFTLARNRTKGNRIIYIVFLLGLVVPVNYIMTVRVLQTLQLINTYLGAILLYTAQFIPFTVFIYYGFILDTPKTLDEAALIDGCGSVRMFFKVIFPLLKPVTSTAMVLNLLNCWNDFIVPLYFLNSSQKWGMVMMMYNYFSKYVSSWNLVCAAMLVNVLPIVIIYIAGQKYLVSGMTAGAVKG